MYLHHIHNFRGLAICAIVCAHALHNFDWTGKNRFFIFFDTLFNQSSIFFFFIAGYLFLYLSDKFEYRKYLKNKFENVIFPYLLLSAPAIILSLTVIEQDVPRGFYDLNIFYKISLFLLSGKHLAPFWFVPTISLLYLLAPALLFLDRCRWPYLILPFLLILSACLGRDGFLYYTGLNGYFSPVSKAVYLFSVYFFGMFCCRFSKNIHKFMENWHLIVFAFVLMFFILECNYYHEQVSFQFLFKILASPLLSFYLLKYSFDFNGLLPPLGTYSFGIFFIHGYVLSFIKSLNLAIFGTDLFMHASIMKYLVLSFITLSICLLFINTIKKIFRNRSRIIVGC